MSVSWEIRQGDCVEVMRKLDEASIDAVVTDPPYGLEFMGAEWDRFKPAAARLRTKVDQRTNGAEKSTVTTPEGYVAGHPFQQWCEEWATEALRVLKPGGHLLAFGGTRTYHRLTSGIEDAGFEIRDCLAWLYGSGFPKSLDPLRMMLSLPRSTSRQQFRRWHQLARVMGGTALKPAFEPIVLARKPLEGSVAANLLEHGTGPLNIDGCRIDARARPLRECEGRSDDGTVYGAGLDGSRAIGTTDEGRWPANVLLDDEAAALLDAISGERPGGGSIRNGHGMGYHGGDAIRQREPMGDSGGASRFFYVAKASAAERNAGLDGMATETVRVHHTPTSTLHDGRSGGKLIDDRKPRPRPRANTHPTVKPIGIKEWLIRRWLVRLACPPDGLVLDPFCGSATTGLATQREGMSFIGIEREPGYCELGRERIRNDQPLLNAMTEAVA